MFTEKVSVYFFSGLGPPDGLAPPAGAGAGAVAPAGAGPPGFATLAGAGTLPNAIDRVIPIFTEKKLGPTPKLRGINA